MNRFRAWGYAYNRKGKTRLPVMVIGYHVAPGAPRIVWHCLGPLGQTILAPDQVVQVFDHENPCSELCHTEFDELAAAEFTRRGGQFDEDDEDKFSVPDYPPEDD